MQGSWQNPPMEHSFVGKARRDLNCKNEKMCKAKLHVTEIKFQLFATGQLFEQYFIITEKISNN